MIPHRQRIRQVSMVIAMIMAVIYLVYRGCYTLNLSGVYAATASLSLYVAECYGCMLMFLYFFQVWDVRNPSPVPPLEDRAVDIFIPTYNEDPDLLRGTISAALAIEYPHKTYVLDDGKRSEVKALCEELGAIYVTRPSNIHAKAGNLNHALEITDGEFLIIFDADHVAESHFIDRLIGYFADEKLGFIQTPHAFYNFDAYQGVLNYEKGTYWEEGMLFYNVTQPGKNRWNGVSFCGSAAMFRREALQDVNLVATESITEDMHTGIRMHAKGWGSLFVNERLIAAQAAPDITSFNTQRLRWGEGNLGIIGFDNPLTMKGLTLAQRLCYLGSMLSWSTGVQKLLIYIAPILMLLTSVPPVVNLSWTLLVLTASYMIAVWTGVKISSNGYGKLWAIELTQMACFWTQVQATWRAIFQRKKANFVVTSKRGRQSNSVLKHIAPQIIYILASVAAITWAGCRYLMHLSDDVVGLSIGSGLLLIHSYLAWVVIRRALRPSDQRYSWRHPAALAVQFEMADGLGETLTGHGITRDINERGLGLLTFVELPEGEDINVTVSIGGRSVHCAATIQWRKTLVCYRSRRDGLTQAYRYGLQFGKLQTEQLNVLWWMGAQYAVARQYETFRGGQFGLDTQETVKLPSLPGEQASQLPIMIELWNGGGAATITETLGQRTFTTLLAEEMPPDTALELQLGTPFGLVQAWASIEETTPRRIAGVDLFETRASFVKFEEESRGMLTSTLGHSTSRELSPIVRLKPEKAKLPAARPAAMLSGVGSLAAGIVAVVAVFAQQDEAAIARVNHGVQVGPDDIDRLRHLVSHIQQARSVDETQVLRLRAALKKLDYDEEVAELDEILARHATTSLHGQILKAISLQNLGKASEAERIFALLVKRLPDFHNDETRAEFLLAAARNAANLNQPATAKRRFELLWQLDRFQAEARGEYAGILWKMDDPSAAIAVLQTERPTAGEMHLVASIYSSMGQFNDAVGLYQKLLTSNPQDQLAKRRMADCYLWGRQYDEAIAVYQELMKGEFGDHEEILHRLAQGWLWSERFPEATSSYIELLEKQPRNREYQDEFLQAAAGRRLLLSEEKRLLRELVARRHERRDDVDYLTHLLNAVSRTDDATLVVNLLEELLVHQPNDAELHLRLADGLHQLRRYAEAETHYTWLLDHTPSTQTTKRMSSNRVH